ncbi:hypothetical protein CP02DC21_0380 [Chlamydia psittaci 02DC21]|nr:hypothetical protein CP02DC21_0380 [Chlamydia psittaci 02DC21]
MKDEMIRSKSLHLMRIFTQKMLTVDLLKFLILTTDKKKF